MFSTAEIAAACGVEATTVRSWLARAPRFRIGSYDGQAKSYGYRDAITFLIAAELLGRGCGSPHEILPLAERIAAGRTDRKIWVYADRDGGLAYAEQQPNDAAIFLPLPALAARLVHRGGQRITRHVRTA